MNHYSLPDPITNTRAELNLRIEALSLFMDRAAVILHFLFEQLEKEIGREDTRFVLYLFGAIQKVYDRRSIPPLIKIFRDREVELTFRKQCIAVLREIYRFSLAVPDFVAGAIISEHDNDPGVQRSLTIFKQLDQNFRIIGEELNHDDRQEIEIALRYIAENPDEVQPLRDEARLALELIWDLKHPKADFITIR